SNTTPRRRPASGSVFCGSWRRTASRWWPLTCHFRPSAMWRSTATSFVGYRAPGSTDCLLGEARTRRPHASEGGRHLHRVLSSYFQYHHDPRTHLSLGKECPRPRPIQLPSAGNIIAFPEVGGLHHRYARRAV